MNLKKKASRSIAIAIVGVSMITPVLNTVSAMEKTGLNLKYENTSKDNHISQVEIDNLVDKYGVKASKTNITLDDLPEGVEPIIVNSIDELDEALSRLDSTSIEVSSENIIGDDFNTRSLARATRMAKFSRGLGITMGKFSTAKFNVYASLNVYRGKITSVNYKDQSLTGYTLGLSLNKGSTSCTISSDKKSARVRGTGTITGYIFIEGIGNIYSKDYTVSGTYRV